jgi:hypothetical protein
MLAMQKGVQQRPMPRRKVVRSRTDAQRSGCSPPAATGEARGGKGGFRRELAAAVVARGVRRAGLVTARHVVKCDLPQPPLTNSANFFRA